MDKILDVKNLRISFRTSNGTVKAVRDISFHLEKGETLAIVGESGSGKSVTSRAIMGILAGNSIVESGEIIYDGKDLLKIPEEDFHYLRGEKVSMIFQDPLSSLNPIIKIGKQLTEAMLIKGKSRQKEARVRFNKQLKLLKQFMNLADDVENNPEKKQENDVRIDSYDKLAIMQVTLEGKYNRAIKIAEESIDAIDDLLFDIEKKVVKNIVKQARPICKSTHGAISDYVVSEKSDNLRGLLNALSSFANSASTTKVYTEVVLTLKQIKEILQEALAYTKPDFFAMAFHLKFVEPTLPSMGIDELNSFLKKQVRDKFLTDFKSSTKKAIEASHSRSLSLKREAINELESAARYFENKDIEQKDTIAYTKTLIEKIYQSIDKLDVKKDNLAYTFRSSLTDAVRRLFSTEKNNEKEQKRFNKQQGKYDSALARGKELDWEVVPANIVDVEFVRAEIIGIIEKLKESYQKQVEESVSFDSSVAADMYIEHLIATASAVVNRVTKGMAKHRALQIMEEVGIPEPRARYNQYPFQFSGGMRQRIVIAIALSVLPDILICDEPTTALDVTIQAQILELINGLKKKHNLSVIFITHDLGVVANMADRIAVMYAGQIVEYGTAEDIFYNPAHPYTWALLSSMPDLETTERLDAIPGTPPNMIYPPKGDAFAARNKYAMEIDFEEQPPMFKISDTHYAATWLLHEDAPKVEMPKIVKERIEKSRKRNKIDEVEPTVELAVAEQEKQEETVPVVAPEEVKEEAPPKKKTTAKKTTKKAVKEEAEEVTEPTADEVVEEVKAEEPAEQKPKKKTTKKAVKAESEAETAEVSEASEQEKQTPKPKKTTKKVAEPKAETAEAEAKADESGEVVEKPKKATPKKTTSTAKKSTTTEKKTTAKKPKATNESGEDISNE